MPYDCQHEECCPKDRAAHTSYYLPRLLVCLFDEAKMMGERRDNHHGRGYQYIIHHYAVVTVTVSGVSETNDREHVWQPEAATELTEAPAAMVTVGAVVDAMGMVNSCEMGCCLVHPQLPLHGT